MGTSSCTGHLKKKDIVKGEHVRGKHVLLVFFLIEGCIPINRLNHNLVHNINEKERQYLVVKSSYRNNALIVLHDKIACLR